MTLADAFALVDRHGFTAIDFEVLTFHPTRDLEAGEDVRDVFTGYESAEPWNKLQIKAWKKEAGRVDLVSSGGHDVAFVGRKVFPIRFLLRHYPIRGQQHGTRKVFAERLDRFAAAERAQGWHIQYDRLRTGHDFLAPPPGGLIEFDPDAVRLNLWVRHRAVEALEERLAAASAPTAMLAAIEQERDRLRALLLEEHALRATVEHEFEDVRAALEHQRQALEQEQHLRAALAAQVADSHAALEQQRDTTRAALAHEAVLRESLEHELLAERLSLEAERTARQRDRQTHEYQFDQAREAARTMLFHERTVRLRAEQELAATRALLDQDRSASAEERAQLDQQRALWASERAQVEQERRGWEQQRRAWEEERRRWEEERRTARVAFHTQAEDLSKALVESCEALRLGREAHEQTTKELRRLEEIVADVRRSKSWRLTAPLRTLRAHLSSLWH
jgi:hypothetical protein